MQLRVEKHHPGGDDDLVISVGLRLPEISESPSMASIRLVMQYSVVTNGSNCKIFVAPSQAQIQPIEKQPTFLNGQTMVHCAVPPHILAERATFIFQIQTREGGGSA